MHDILINKLIELAESQLRALRRIERQLTQYSIRIKLYHHRHKEHIPMSLTTITAGTAVTATLTLLADGTAFDPTTDPNYSFAPTLTASDPAVVITAGSAPNLFSVEAPASDTATTVTLSASAADPKGGTASGSLTVTIAPASVPTVFTVDISLA